MSSPPTTLGKYQIIREIARSNDIVYEAYDALMNRRVALKELSMPTGFGGPQKEERVNRFKREARAAGTLAHPNIMTVYELGEDGDRYFIAMEFLDGHTLRNEIDTKGSIPIDQAIEYAIEVLRGLEFAHSKGVIHRDIKPDNIQMLSDGRIKLTDFGIARLTFEPNLTMDGQVFGTPSYMSPEQVVGKEIDARSDLFSLAIVLYEMIGGRKPFAGDSVVSITYAIMNKEPDRLHECNYSLWSVLTRALDKSPALRYPSAASFIEALEAATLSAANGPVLDPIASPSYGQPTFSYGNQQTGPQPIAPPVIYPYNPFNPPPPGQGMANVYTPSNNPNLGPPSLYSGNAYQPSPYAPQQAPIYYPPPPRVPLLKAETRDFLGRLFLWLLIGGTLILVGLVLIQTLVVGLKSTQNEANDQKRAVVVNRMVADLPPREQIEQLQKFRDQLQSDTVRDQEDRLTAAIYSEEGRKFFDVRDYASAERECLQASRLDPTNSTYLSQLGEIYSTVARTHDDLAQSLELWSRASKDWMDAARFERDPVTHGKFAIGAAQATYNYATQLYANRQLNEAKSALLDAQRLAPVDSEVSQRVESLLKQVNGAGQ